MVYFYGTVRLHNGASVNLKVGNASPRSIPYTVGVKQGDVMVPLLFLFLMQAFAETLEDSWEEADIEVPTYLPPQPRETHRETN